MKLEQAIIDEFKAICRDEFSVEFSDEEAHQRALEFVDLFWLLFVEQPHGSKAIDDGNGFDSPPAGPVS